MAVTKIWAIHDSVSRVVDYCTNPSKTKLSDLEQVLLYAADKEKTLDEGEQQYAVTGIGCRAESAAREMAAVQRRFGKAGGNVAYHAYQSFKTGEVTAEECHRIGVETARRLWGNDRQVLVATHFNTGTYHNHFVVNPVNMWTGKKLEAKYEVYYKLRDCALPGFVDSKNEEKTERNAGYLVVSHSGGGMLRQGTRKGIRRTPANRGMRAHWVVKGLDISEDVCHGMCP